MTKKRRISGNNESWSMDDPRIRRQDKAGTGDPDAGLHTVDRETAATERPADADEDETLDTTQVRDALSSAPEEGGAVTQDVRVFHAATSGGDRNDKKK
ncbi:MAG: hypothetical protein PHW10_04470 [Candidatus Peribacteraceae bacterium]|nr:hypothetical protein [Candidatus Peribacteraceae bacterium]